MISSCMFTITRLIKSILKYYHDSHFSILLINEEYAPRSMTPEAVFREFPSGPLGKTSFPGRTRQKMQGSGGLIRLPVWTGFCRFQAELDKFGYRNTASMKS